MRRSSGNGTASEMDRRAAARTWFCIEGLARPSKSGGSEEKTLLPPGRRAPEQFEDWAQNTELALSADEGRFLAESRNAQANFPHRRAGGRRSHRRVWGGGGNLTCARRGGLHDQQTAQSEVRWRRHVSWPGRPNDSLDEDPGGASFSLWKRWKTTRSAGDRSFGSDRAYNGRCKHFIGSSLELPIGRK